MNHRCTLGIGARRSFGGVLLIFLQKPERSGVCTYIHTCLQFSLGFSVWGSLLGAYMGTFVCTRSPHRVSVIADGDPCQMANPKP